MHKLQRSDLLTLEAYAQERNAYRQRVMQHKKRRTVHLGEHVTLVFEDRLSVQYQIQEMLRIERIFEAAGIEEELAAYNPLIPDGSNLKATLLIEYPDAEHRRQALATLGGIEHHFYAAVAGQPRVVAVADEDLDRSEGEKTSAVHFLRYEFPTAAVIALRAGADLRLGIDDARLALELTLSLDMRDALCADFSGA